MENQEMKQLERASRKSGLISLAGVAIFIASLLYASISLNKTNTKLQVSQSQISSMAYQIDSLNLYFKKLNEDIGDMKADEQKLTDFLIQLIKSSTVQSRTMNQDIDWEKLSAFMTDLPSGKRKTALFIALLTTWKEIPFELGTKNPATGFDSPSFLRYVINQVGISVENQPQQYLSTSLMSIFKKADKPLPGDMLFYEGEVGSFGLLYLCDCALDGSGLAIGTLQKSAPLAVYEVQNINTSSFPLIGYFRVNYEDYE